MAGSMDTPRGNLNGSLFDGSPLTTLGSPAQKLEALETMTENSMPDEEDMIFEGARPNSAFKAGKRRMSSRQRLLTKSNRKSKPRRASTTAVVNQKRAQLRLKNTKKAWEEEENRPGTAPMQTNKTTRLTARLATSAKPSEDDNLSSTSSDDLNEVLPEPIISPMTYTLNKSLRRSSKRLLSAGGSNKKKKTTNAMQLFENSTKIANEFDHTYSSVREMMVEIKEQENANPAKAQKKKQAGTKKKRPLHSRRREIQEEEPEEQEGKIKIPAKYKGNTLSHKVKASVYVLAHDKAAMQQLDRDISNFERENAASIRDAKMTADQKRIGGDVIPYHKLPVTDAMARVQARSKRWHQENKRSQEMQSLRRRELTLKREQHIENLRDTMNRRHMNALKYRTETKYMIMQQERAIKWGYIVAFWTRMLIWCGRLEDARETRHAIAERKRLTTMIYSRMMPIVWEQRSLKWKAGFERFKQHFVFYQLWIDIKRKKEATQVIRSFLTETMSSLRLVRQVHQFRSKIKRAQHYISKFLNTRLEMRMAMLLQFLVVECKVILDEPLLTSQQKCRFLHSRSSSAAANDGAATPTSTTSSRPSSRASRKGSSKKTKKPKSKKSKSKKSKKESKNDFFKQDGSEIVAESLTLVRADFDIKMQLIDEEIAKQIDVYNKAIPAYKKAKADYDFKYRQMISYHRAQAILEGDMNEDEIEMSLIGLPLTDKAGNIVPEPEQPSLIRILPEHQMKALVLRGFELVFQNEQDIYWEIVEKHPESAVQQDTACIKYENQYMKNVMKSFRVVKKYYGDDLYNYYEATFKQANMRVSEAVRSRRETKTIIKQNRGRRTKRSTSKKK